MDAIEERARQLLAAVSKERYGWIGELWNIALRDSPGKVTLSGSDAINAVVAALTPPEGYVLVPLESLTESEKDVALGQAVELATYVERQAKGSMREAAQRFLSLGYAQEIARRLEESRRPR